MKTVVKNVYYCDFCNKRSLSASHTKKHEKHCTKNPDRECGLCKQNIDLKPLIEKYSNRYEIVEHISKYEGLDFENIEFKWIGEPVKYQQILNDVEGCPVCALAVVRLSGLSDCEVNRDEFDYPYVKELKIWWDEENSQHSEDYY